MHRLASVATSSASHTGILSTPMAYGSAPRTSTPGMMVMKNICRMFLRRVYIFPVYGSPLRMQRERCKMLRTTVQWTCVICGGTGGQGCLRGSSATARWTKSSRRSVSYTHLRAHETRHDLVCRLLLEKKKKKKKKA